MTVRLTVMAVLVPPALVAVMLKLCAPSVWALLAGVPLMRQALRLPSLALLKGPMLRPAGRVVAEAQLTIGPLELMMTTGVIRVPAL